MGIEGSFGVGDLLLRTKYRLGSLDDFGFAAGLVLGMPTGNLRTFAASATSPSGRSSSSRGTSAATTCT